MFNTYHYDSGADYPQKVDVTERRAPTVESARFLHELEEQARKRVLEINELANNKISAVWVVEHDPMHRALLVIGRIKINDQDIEFRTRVDRSMDRASVIFKKLMEQLSIELLRYLVADNEQYNRIYSAGR